MKLNDYEAENEKLLKSIREAEVAIRNIKLTQKADDADVQLKNLLENVKKIGEEDLYRCRLQLSQLFKEKIASIQIYTKGRVSNTANFSKLNKTLQSEATKIAVAADADVNLNGVFLPFFVVNYRTGESRLVAVNPADSGDLITSYKTDTSGNVEYPSIKIFESDG